MSYDDLPDIQSQPDYRKIPLDRVGVKGLHWPITVLDRKKVKQSTIATINMYVNLPHDYRGTHLSRLVELLNDYRDTEWIDRTGEILAKIRKILKADEAYMEVEFDYFVEKEAPVTGLGSLMSYTCRFRASFKEREDFIIAVSVPVITLCPCSKEISAYGAHNQRCTVTVQVRYREFVWLEDLIDIVESSGSGGLYSVLKRPDEKYVTEHAYNNPKFVEDVVREVALKLDRMDSITWYVIEADSQESIHNHNAYARVEKTK
ncbi:GTP cyclohydrolase FolE2 [bacterium]|nr:GTP cyclohydrolase FolE2 [bacterium]